MKRTVLAIALFLTMLALPPVLSAQDDVCYVLVEKEGLDLYIGLYSTVQQTKDRITLVKSDNAKRRRVNAAVRDAVKELGEQISTKKRDLVKAEKKKDAATVATLRREIVAIEQAIVEKKTERVLIVKLSSPKTFRSRRAAEAFMARRYNEADEVKKNAEEEEREAEKKRRAEEAAGK